VVEEICSQASRAALPSGELGGFCALDEVAAAELELEELAFEAALELELALELEAEAEEFLELPPPCCCCWLSMIESCNCCCCHTSWLAVALAALASGGLSAASALSA